MNNITKQQFMQNFLRCFTQPQCSYFRIIKFLRTMLLLLYFIYAKWYKILDVQCSFGFVPHIFPCYSYYWTKNVFNGKNIFTVSKYIAVMLWWLVIHIFGCVCVPCVMGCDLNWLNGLDLAFIIREFYSFSIFV